ncbi:hypothetical protein X943_002696 [Babesia divergens]|uniref:Uncharacterized protein n=1 Tax=Babesia divergens TaxID=32595 RepID=A0AAD9G7F8_BABDI|nr:hypothetical protein X943_002696 [Babesia divergens]
MTPYGIKLPGLTNEVLDEVERKYSNATKVTDEIVKVPAVNLDVCDISSPTRGSGQRSCSHASSTASSPSSADDKTEKLIAKITATNPNMSPAFRIIADSKFCLKGNNNQSPESIHRRGW